MDVYIAFGYRNDFNVPDQLFSCHRVVFSESKICDSDPVQRGSIMLVNDEGEAAEIMATIDAFEAALKGVEPNIIHTITVHTNSEHIYNAMTSWITRWRVNGWKNIHNIPLVNVGLWQALDNIVKINRITWKYYDAKTTVDPHELFVAKNVNADV